MTSPNIPAKHGPNRLDNYLQIHKTVMRQFQDAGFAGNDTLEVFYLGPNLFMSGEVACQGHIVIRVDKILEVLSTEDPPLVRTSSYAYNVSLASHGNLFRYDNNHPDYLREGHADPHHKHLFDWESNDELPSSPQWIGADNWPTLGEVIQEAWEWHCANYDKLDHPEEFATDIKPGAMR